MIQFYPSSVRLNTAVLSITFASLIIGNLGQLGDTPTKDNQNGPTRDFNPHTGNGLHHQGGKDDINRKSFTYDEPGLSTSKTESDDNYETIISVEDTFIACVNGSSIKNSVTYLNLTQVIENEKYRWKKTETSACFFFCKNSAPSLYISFQEAFDQSTQSCGCHDEFEENLEDVKQDESMCESSPGFMRLYCGPSNIECLNASPSLCPTTLIILGSSIFVGLFTGLS